MTTPTARGFLSINKAQEEQRSHKNDFIKLDKAIPAINLFKLYETRQSVIAKFTSHQKRVSEVKKCLHELQAQLKRDNKSFKDISERHHKLQESKNAHELLIYHTIMPLDKEILSLEEQTQEPEQKLLNVETNLGQKKNQLAVLLEKQKEISQYLDKLTAWLKQQNHFKGLEKNLTLLQQLAQNGQALEENIAKGEQNLKNYHEFSMKLKGELEATDENLGVLKAASAELINGQVKIESILKDKDPSNTLQTRFEQKSNKNIIVQNLPQNALRLRDLNHSLLQKKQRFQTLENELKKLSQQLPEISQKLKDKETILGQARALLEKNKMIQDLQAYRDKLKPGDNCMVCGSKEHPAIKEYSSLTTNDDQNNCKVAEKELLETQKELIGIQKDIEKNTESSKTLKIDLDKEQQSLNEELKKWQDCCNTLQVTIDAQDEKQITDFVNKFSQNFNELSIQITQTANLEKELSEYKTKKLHKENKVSQALSQKKILEERIHNGAMKTKELSETVQTDKQKLLELQQQITERLPSQLSGTTTLEKLHAAQQGVILFQQELKNEQESTQALSDNKHTINTENKSISELEKSSKELKEKLNSLKLRHKKLTEKRHLLFEKKSTQTELKRIQETFNKSNKELDLKKHELDNLKKNESSQQALEKELLSSAEVLQSETESSTINFQKALDKSSFSSEEELLKNILKEDEISSLEKLRQTVKETITVCSTRFKDLTLSLEQESARKLTAKSFEDLLKIQEELKVELQNILSSKNELLFKLKKQDELKEQLAEKTKTISLQQKNFNLWATLSSLIGSADDQAFRNFAQGLTLDHLILLANIHLERLHERYFLARSDDDSLNLNIIDSYQADTLRPVETLSGGESFLVSLALALALSDLASDRVSIESLFLDEGFGTLDPETLETALTALDHLQASGRMIGVISHVQTLKERIPGKIQLYSNEGMGISRLDDIFAVNSSKNV